MRSSVASVFLALLLCSCASSSTARVGQPGSGVAGSYTGRFTFQGQRFAATMQLRREGATSVEGAFRVSGSVEIEGRVRGSVIDDLMRLTVDYGSLGGCGGHIEGILTIESGGATLDGPVTVTDCAGPVAGHMSFERQERSPRTNPMSRPVQQQPVTAAPPHHPHEPTGTTPR
jgi:hypothetical protein